MSNGGIIHRNGDDISYVRLPYAVLVIIITIMLALIPAVMAYGVLNEKVNNLETEWSTAGPRHTETITNIEARLNQLEKIASGTEVSLQSIKEDIGEIKTDIKEVKQDLKGHATLTEGGG